MITKDRAPYRIFFSNSERYYRTTIGSGAVVGCTIGGLLFTAIGMLVNAGTIAVPALYSSTLLLNQSALILGAMVLGVFFGGASGALVGIGISRRI